MLTSLLLAIVVIFGTPQDPIHYVDTNAGAVTSTATIPKDVVGIQAKDGGTWLGVWTSWLQAATPGKRAQLELWISGNAPNGTYGRSNVARASGEFVPTQGAFLVQPTGSWYPRLRVREYDPKAIATAKNSSLTLMRMDHGPGAFWYSVGFDHSDWQGQTVTSVQWQTIHVLRPPWVQWSGTRRFYVIGTGEFMPSQVGNDVEWRLIEQSTTGETTLAEGKVSVFLPDGIKSRESQACMKLQTYQWDPNRYYEFQIRSPLGAGNARRMGILIFDLDAWLANYR